MASEKSDSNSSASIATAMPDMCGMVLRTHEVDQSLMANLEACADTGRALMKQGVKRMGAQVAYCYAISDMKAMLLGSPKMVEFMAKAQNDPLFFRTDNPSGYPAATVAGCLVKASMAGLPWIGNLFNIIGGNFYLTKEGAEYILSDMGVPFYVDIVSIDEGRTIKGGVDRNGRQMADIKTVIVQMVPHWTDASGKDQWKQMSAEIRWNANATPDSVVGKAKCRAYKYIIDIVARERKTGIAFDVTDGVVQAEIPAENLLTAAKDKAARKEIAGKSVQGMIEERIAGELSRMGANVLAKDLLSWLSMQGTPVKTMDDCERLVFSLEGAVEAFVTKMNEQEVA